MVARIAFPAAAGMAVALGIGMSTLVPTKMIAVPPPSWASTSPDREGVIEPGPTWRFAVAPPVDLDPSLAVGPVEDRQPYAMDEDAVDPAPGTLEVPDKTVFVAVNYGIGKDRVEAMPSSEPVQAEQTKIVPPPEFAAIY